MENHQNPTPQSQSVVCWIIWFAILNGLVITQIFAGGGIPHGPDRGDPPLVFPLIAAGLVVISLGIRFFAIPKIDGLQRKLPLMIIGLAVSEAIGIMGAFVVGREFATTRLVLFAASILCIVCQAPIYARLKTSV